jgi:hypothetical protein
MKLQQLNDDGFYYVEASCRVDGIWHHFGLIWPKLTPADVTCSVVWQWRQAGIMTDKLAGLLIRDVIMRGNEAIVWPEEDN